MKKELLKSMVKVTGKEIVKNAVISLAIAGATQLADELITDYRNNKKQREEYKRNVTSNELNKAMYIYNKSVDRLIESNKNAKRVKANLEYDIRKSDDIIKNINTGIYRCIRNITSSTGFRFERGNCVKLIKKGTEYTMLLDGKESTVFYNIEDTLFNKYFVCIS